MGDILTGGVLIGPRLVLSAAHCDGSANEYQIGASSSVMDGESISIQQSIIHPDFNPAQFSGDVMLSILEDSTDKPYLQLEPNPVVGGKVTVIGFGDVDSGPSLDLSSYLQEVELDYIDNDTCDAEHGDFNQVTADMMCATGINKDACFGDSGGRKCSGLAKLLYFRFIFFSCPDIFNVHVSYNGSSHRQGRGLYGRSACGDRFVGSRVCSSRGCVCPYKLLFPLDCTDNM